MSHLAMQAGYRKSGSRCRTRAEYQERDWRLHEELRRYEAMGRGQRSGPAVSLRRLRLGDVVLATIPFADGSGQKKRPVIVVDRRQSEIVVLACTSQVHHSGRRGFVPLADLAQAGLPKRSLINTIREVTVSAADLHQRLGHCSDRDWTAVLASRSPAERAE